MAGPGFEVECAFVLVDYFRGDGQSKAGAIVLRAEEGIKQSFLHFGRDALASVLDFQRHGPRQSSAQLGVAINGAQRDRALVTDAVGGVLNEIDEHLLELERIGQERGFGHRSGFQLDGLAPELGREEIAHLAERGLSGERGELRLAWPRELEKVFQDLLQPVDFVPEEPYPRLDMVGLVL